MLAKLAPHDCLGCHSEGALLCSACLSSLSQAPKLKVLDWSALDSVAAAVLYQGLAKKLIWRLKSNGAQEAAVIMADKMASLLPTKKCLLVSVPTATSRVRQRGYDQSYLLARALARNASLPWLNCLARMGQAHQVGSNIEQRKRQLAESFRVKQERFVKGAHLILVDDVVTTGSTLEAAAKILKQAGAARVDALTFAYAPLNQRA
jgi:ComF family protein